MLSLRSLTRIALGLVLSVCLIQAASAHAQLVGSDPQDASMTASEPAAVMLTFNEPVAVLALAIVAPDGTIHPVSGAGAGTSIRLAPPEGLGPGTRVVSYRVMSEDGHPVAGTLTYSVGVETEPVPSGDGAISPVLAILLAARWLSLSLLAVGVGGAVFVAFVAPVPRLERRLRIASGLVIVPLAAWLAATAYDMTGQLDGQSLGAALASPTGRTQVLFALAGLLAAMMPRSGPGRRLLSIAAMILAAIGFSASGHASTADARGLMRPIVAAHAAAALFWAGALLPLLAVTFEGQVQARRAIERFSQAAVVMVGALAVTGAVLAFVQMETFDAFASTRYGRLLAVKLGLVVVLLAVALLNRLRLTARVGEGRPVAFRKAILVDLIVMAGVLAVVAGWRVTPPPRAIHAVEAAGLIVHIHTQPAMADIVLQPARRGGNRLTIGLMTGDFGALDPKEVNVVLVDSRERIEPVERPARKDADGRWRVDALPVPLSGRYTLRLVLLIDDFTQSTIETTVDIKP